MLNLNFVLMVNLSFKSVPPNLKDCCSGFKNYRETSDSLGRSVLVECDDPYVGLSADSFSLQAQIDAGVPLQHIAPVSSSSLSAIDENNRQGELFINQLEKQLVPQLNGN